MSLWELAECQNCTHAAHSHYGSRGTGRCKIEDCDCMWFRSPFAPKHKEQNIELNKKKEKEIDEAIDLLSKYIF